MVLLLPQQWHQQDRPPGRSRSRYISSYQCHNVWFSCCRQLESQLQSWWPALNTGSKGTNQMKEIALYLTSHILSINLLHFIALLIFLYNRSWVCVCGCVHLCRANGLTQFTGNATLLSIRVAAEGMFSSEARWKGALLKWIVDGGRFTEQVTHGHCQTCRRPLPKNQRWLLLGWWWH